MSGPAVKVKADDVAALFRKEIQDVVGKLRMVNTQKKIGTLIVASLTVVAERNHTAPGRLPC